jgi:hypothetical protein
MDAIVGKETYPMKQKTLWLAVTLLTFTLALWSADITGKWTAQVPGRNGQTREVTFTLNSSGDALTGTMSGRNGDIPIADGKISGDTISFSVTQDRGGNTVKQTYTGKATGSEIKFKREGGQGEPIEFVAKKAS